MPEWMPHLMPVMPQETPVVPQETPVIEPRRFLRPEERRLARLHLDDPPERRAQPTEAEPRVKVMGRRRRY
jgi:hypothetical protein